MNQIVKIVATEVKLFFRREDNPLNTVNIHYALEKVIHEINTYLVFYCSERDL